MSRFILFVILLAGLILPSLADTNLVSLSVSPSKTLVLGQKFSFSAVPLNASIFWRYRYMYYAYDSTSAQYLWTPLSGWSSNPNYIWTPNTAQVGTGTSIQVAVYLQSAAGGALLNDNNTSKQASDIQIISVRPRLSKLNLSASPSGSSSLGSIIKLSANTINGNIITGALVKYRFRYSDGNGWKNIQDYSTSPNATWQPDTTGTYFIEVCAKEYSYTPIPTNDYDLRYQIIYKVIAGATTVTTTVNPTTIILTNPVTISAISDIKTNAEYSYYYSDDNGLNWKLIQNFSTMVSTIFYPTTSGDFLIKSRVRSIGNLADYEAESQSVSLHVNPKSLTGTDINVTPANSVVIGNTVTINGVSQGGLNPLYRISIKTADGTVLPISNAYQLSGNFNWIPDTKGNYAITVDCKETTSINDYDFRKTINYQVLENQTNIQISDFKAVPLSPYSFTNGMFVTLTASIKTGVNPEYKFTYTDLTGEYIIRDYSIDPTSTWTPTKSGNYSLKVYVRSFGDTVTAPLVKSIQYTLNDLIIIPDITDVTISIAANPPYTINNPITLNGSATGGKNVEYMFTYRRQSDVFATEYNIKPYDLAKTVNFIPTKEDNYRLYVYAREQGSYEQYKVFSYKDIAVLNNIDKPTNLKVNQTASGANISWDFINGAYNFAVRKRLYGATVWTVLKSDISGTSSIYSDTFLPLNSTTYDYQVGNVDKLSGNITWSDSVYLSIGLSWWANPNSYINYSAQSASQDKIDVTWSLYPGVDGYNLQYSSDGINWIDLNNGIASNVSSFTHQFVNTSTTDLPLYTYRVQAYKNLTDSTGTLKKSYSEWLVQYDQSTIDFSWSDAGADSYNLEYSSDGQFWSKFVTNIDKTKRLYNYYYNTVPEPSYSYRVRGYKSGDIGVAYQSVINRRTIFKYESVYPVLPSFTSIVTTGTTIKLNWSATTYAQFYEIGRFDNNIDTGKTWINTGSSYIDGKTIALAVYPMKYQYKIRAWNQYHVSDWVYQSSLTAPSNYSYILPIKPTWVSATYIGNAIELIWNCPSGFTFDINRTGGNGAANYTSTNSNYTNNGISFNTTNTYMVRAVSPSQGYPATVLRSDYSDPISVTSGTISYNLNLQITSVAHNNLNLSWTAHPDATANYDVEKWSTASPTWTNVKTAVNFTTYQDTTIPITTSNNAYTNVYMYRVRVRPTVAPAGTSQWDIVRVYNVNVDDTKVTAIDNKDLTLSLSWPAVIGAFEYKVCRHQYYPNDVWTYININSSLSSYVDGVDIAYPPLEWGARYRYHFVPIYDNNTQGILLPCTSYSTRDTADLVITLIPDIPVINSVTLTAQNTASLDVTLPANTDRYDVERLVGSNTWVKVNQNALAASPWEDTTVPPNTNTQYRVRAYLLANPTNYSPYCVTFPFINLAEPPTPLLTALTATQVSDTAINLAWSYPAKFGNSWLASNPYPDPKSFDIVYGTNADLVNPVNTINIAGNLRTYSHTGLTPDTTYWFKLYAYNYDVVPDMSTTCASAGANTSPLAPVLTVASVDCHNINISWTFTPNNVASAYSLEVDNYDGLGWFAVVPPVSTSPYIESNLLPGTKRGYRLSASRILAPAYTTLWSNIISTQTRDLPVTPVITLSTINDTTIQMKWSKIFANTTPALTECSYKYRIKKSTDNNYSAWIDINGQVDIGNNQYSLDITGLLPNVKYQIFMQTVDLDGNASVDSTVNSIITTTGKPALTLISKTFNTIKVSWIAVAGAKSYTINVNPGADITEINAGLTQFEITALADNSSYDIKLKVISDAGVSAWSDILTVSTPPIAPTLTVTKVDDANVLLNWNENYNPIINYNIERLSANGTVFTITSLNSGKSDFITGAGASFKYRINVQTTLGTSAWSNYVVYSLNPDLPVLSFKALSQTSIQISWNAVANAESYELQRKSGVNWIKISSFSPATDINLSSGTTYTYRIQSIGKNGTVSDWSTGDGSTKTAVPYGLTAVATNDGKVSINWIDVNGETGYNVQRSLDGISWTSLADTFANVTTLIDSTIVNGKKYYYRVASFNLGGISDYSPAITVSSVSDAPVLSAQSASANAVYLTWTNVTGETGYELQKLIGVDWVLLKTTTADINIYTDTNVTTGNIYSYRVRSLVNNMTSTWSAVKSVTTKPNVPVIAIVTNFDKSVTLTWSDVSGETGYRIEKNVNNIGWVLLIETDASTFTLNDPNIANDFISYRVSSFNAGGYSTWSNIVTTSTVPVAPILTGIASSNILITLSWPAIPNSNYYEIQKMVGNIWMIHGTTKSTQSYASGLKGCTTYKFRVRAYNNIGVSAWSNEVLVLTKPNAPVLVGKVKGLTTNTLTWGIIPGSTGYNVYRDNILLTNVMLSPATVTYTDKVASYSTGTYYVIAVNDSGNSNASNKVTLTTK
jgi:titin